MAIFHAVLPRSPEWKQLRLGIATSSEFSDIITPKKLEYSKSAEKLMYIKLAEWMTGQPTENSEYESQWMARGVELEDNAIAAYEMLTERETSLGGFFTTDDGLLGCSPDRLIGDAGDLEIKCPLIHSQIGYALGSPVDEAYMLQLQGRMMIHGRMWIDIFSYHPKLLLPPVRVNRDEKIINIMRERLAQFNQTMLQCRLVLEQRFGPFVRPEPEPEPDFRDAVTDADVEAILAAQRRGEL